MPILDLYQWQIIFFDMSLLIHLTVEEKTSYCRKSVCTLSAYNVSVSGLKIIGRTDTLDSEYTKTICEELP